MYIQVISNCSNLPTYIPIGRIRNGHFTDISGIMTNCHSNGVIEVNISKDNNENNTN